MPEKHVQRTVVNWYQLILIMTQAYSQPTFSKQSGCIK